MNSETSNEDIFSAATNNWQKVSKKLANLKGAM